jgi:hypothetical protein
MSILEPWICYRTYGTAVAHNWISINGEPYRCSWCGHTKLAPMGLLPSAVCSGYVSLQAALSAFLACEEGLRREATRWMAECERLTEGRSTRLETEAASLRRERDEARGALEHVDAIERNLPLMLTAPIAASAHIAGRLDKLRAALASALAAPPESARKLTRRCACGCGLLVEPDRQYVSDHTPQPAGTPAAPEPEKGETNG